MRNGLIISILILFFIPITAFGNNYPTSYTDDDVTKACPLSFIKSKIPFVKECMIEKILILKNKDISKQLIFVIMEFNKSSSYFYPLLGGVLFKKESGFPSWEIVWHFFPTDEADFFSFYKDELKITSQNQLIFIPINDYGTAHNNRDKILSFNKENITLLDSESWLKEEKKLLPKDKEIWGGVRINIQQLTAESQLWKKTDANACGTAGKITWNLEISNNKVLVKDRKISEEYNCN